MNFFPNDFDWRFFIFELLIGELVVTIVAALIAFLIIDKVRTYLQTKKFGGWQVVIKNGDKVVEEFDVSIARQMEIGNDKGERDVFLKGRTSPHAWIAGGNIDKLLTIEGKKYVIDLAKNKPTAKKPWRIVNSRDKQPLDWLKIDKQDIELDLDELLKLFRSPDVTLTISETEAAPDEAASAIVENETITVADSTVIDEPPAQSESADT